MSTVVHVPSIQFTPMPTDEFLSWIADRLVFVHGEPANADYVQALRKLADTTSPTADVTPAEGASPQSVELHPDQWRIVLVAIRRDAERQEERAFGLWEEGMLTAAKYHGQYVEALRTTEAAIRQQLGG